MTYLSASSRSQLLFKLVLVVSICLLTACAIQSRKKSSYAELQRTLAQREASLKAMEDKMAKAQLQLLEKDAQLKELEKRSYSQQIILDEAILEVVRAKAKLRSLESKAEAASQMAEAEIAVKAFKAQLKGQEPDENISKAEQLLKMSAQEFKKENYGGALFLTSQAKSHIRASQIRIGSIERIEPVEGEILFAQPVPLKVLKTSNLRQRPDLKSKVLAKLAKGALLIGYSYKDQWVRVTGEGGTNGWVFQTLVGGR